MRKLLLYSFLLFFFLLSSPVISEDLKSKVDDLFIKASSGTEKDRDLVEPSKNSLIKIGKDAVPYLLKKLKSEDWTERGVTQDRNPSFCQKKNCGNYRETAN